MDRPAAVKIIKDTFEKPFKKEQFVHLVKNVFNQLDESNNFVLAGSRLPHAGAYQPYVNSMERIGKYQDDEGQKIDSLVVYLKKEKSLERARTMQRNFVADYLSGTMAGDLKDAALVAFVSPDEEDWRFSLVKMDYHLEETPTGKTKVRTELTPARRWSFLVGQNESSHTAQRQLLPMLESDSKPSLAELEKAFNIEVVTREFFKKYRDLFHRVEESLKDLVGKDAAVRSHFTSKDVDIINFSKKLLGQIVFLYFLQKKGWLGVPGDKTWGEGNRRFLRALFEQCANEEKNFFNDCLEYLFYDALNKQDRGSVDPGYCRRFNCKIPFLNGGLFDPINSYDWENIGILIPDGLFSNTEKTKEGDIGTGILDVFDRYNFTVKEDEPLEKEVAIDPEMLGKVFENLLEVKDRKSKGTYYTPREIVHYMCQESLINYLDTTVNSGEVSLAKVDPVNLKLFGAPATQQMALKTDGYTGRVHREDIEAFVRMGEMAIEHDVTALQNLDRIEQGMQKTTKYQLKLRSIQENASLIDKALANIRMCDPAVGSGAFLVGLMTEIVRARDTLSTYLPHDLKRTKYNFKRDAIQNCLYGVDIDPGAVEIAKLRLWLSLVVDEENISDIEPLPNLDYKVMQGDSLVDVFHGISLYASDRQESWRLMTAYREKDRLVGDLHVKQNELFNAKTPGDKTRLKGEVEDAIIAVFRHELERQRSEYCSEVDAAKRKASPLPKETDRQRYLAGEMARLEKKYNFDFEAVECDLREMTHGNKVRQFFPWRLYFADIFQERGGFDIVIANPPYGFRKVLTGDEKNYFRKQRGIAFPSGDIAELFIIVSLGNLVHEKGNLTFIIPKKSLYGESWKNVRRIWVSNRLTYLMDASKAFEKVLLEQVSFSIIKQKDRPGQIVVGALNQRQDRIDIFGCFAIEEIFSENLENAQIYKGVVPGSLLKKIKTLSVTDTSKLIRAEIGISNITEHLTFQDTGNYPCVKGIDIIKYGLKSQKRYLKGKVAKQCLSECNNDKLVSQEIVAHVQNPYPHIVITMFYDDHSRLINDTCVEIRSLSRELDKKFLLGYYQSAFCNWYAYNFVYNRAIRTMHFIDYYITQIPIPKCVIESPSRQKAIIDLVSQILAITKDEDYPNNHAKQSEVERLEGQIDEMVYQLYGLTPGEIDVVKGKNAKTNESA